MDEKNGLGRFGGSLKVDNVQALAANVSSEIPDRYVRPERKVDVVTGDDEDTGESIPVIDFGRLFDSEYSNEEAAKLHSACEDWGFFQILCNGKYKSIEHRAVVNDEKARLSVAGFHTLNIGDVVRPIPEIVKRDKLLYKILLFDEYLEQLFTSKLEGKSILDRMKLDE